MNAEKIKPLGGKIYGSIPHLPGSKYGDKRDRGVSPEAAVRFLEKPKQAGDVVFVTEKLDGSCVCVAKTPGGALAALIRAGYPAQSSQWLQHRWFAQWAMKHHELFDGLLKPGERVCGEWLAQAHGTRYNLSERPLQSPFAAFDIMCGWERESYERFFYRCGMSGISTVPLVSRGPAVDVDSVMGCLGKHGRYGAERPEGAVWRIERDGEFIDIAKYVRPDHVVGGLLPEVSGGDEVWNWRPDGADI